MKAVVVVLIAVMLLAAVLLVWGATRRPGNPNRPRCRRVAALLARPPSARAPPLCLAGARRLLAQPS